MLHTALPVLGAGGNFSVAEGTQQGSVLEAEDPVTGFCSTWWAQIAEPLAPSTLSCPPCAMLAGSLQDEEASVGCVCSLVSNTGCSSASAGAIDLMAKLARSVFAPTWARPADSFLLTTKIDHKSKPCHCRQSYTRVLLSQMPQQPDNNLIKAKKLNGGRLPLKAQCELHL